LELIIETARFLTTNRILTKHYGNNMITNKSLRLYVPFLHAKCASVSKAERVHYHKKNLILGCKWPIGIAESLLFFMLFLLSNCSKNMDRDGLVLAKAGDTIITDKAFRLNYEFGFPRLKKGPDPKRSYLNYMVMESILSQEGYKLGYDQSERVKKLEKSLIDDLIVEELYKKEISDKIHITPEQVRDAYIKSSTSWKLRCWMEPNLSLANREFQAMKAKGYIATPKDTISNSSKNKISECEFETDYLTYLDIPEDLLKAIKDLPVGDISPPIEQNGKYYIFQIMEIKRHPVAEYDYLNESKRYYNLLYYKEFKKAASQYVSAFMIPKKVVTKKHSLLCLLDALVEWEKFNPHSRQSFLREVEAADSLKPALFKLQKALTQTLVEYKGGKWSIYDFIDRFDPLLIRNDSHDQKLLFQQLNEQVALHVRDYLLAEKAKSMNLHKSKDVNEQVVMWRNKYVYEEMRRHVIMGVIGADSLLDTEMEHRINTSWNSKPVCNLLMHVVDSLKSTITVKINESVLDTLSVSETNNSRLQSIQVFKMSNNRLAIPVVDPALGY
jgi:hypothetical protein